VRLREDTPGEKRLVAYVVWEPLATDGLSALRTYLNERLPEYMVPSAFVGLDELPLTPNGKVDRHALPAPDGRHLGMEHDRVAPRNAIEQILAGIFEAVLGVEGIGVYDAFFELGGHSLLATQVVSRLREAFGVELPLRVLFETPTVAGLAERVAAAAPPRGQAERVAEVVQRLKSMSADERRALLEREKLARERA
jgi:acyl carrier protein